MPTATGKVIEFRPKKASTGTKQAAPPVISQERLLQMMALQLEEAKLVRQVREHMLALQADIASGAQLEEGPLTFDLDIRMVKRTSLRVQNG